MKIDLKTFAASMALAIPALAIASSDASAYVGPGIGLSALGAIVAFFSVIVLAIIGFIWYPIKRLLHRTDRQKIAPQALGRPQNRE